MADTKTPASADGGTVAPANTRTPAQWAETFFPASHSGRMHAGRWQHSAAEALHGWRAYESRTGSPVLLDQQTYEAAIAATSGNDFRPHPAADYRTKG
jgi:hypothetical protein